MANRIDINALRALYNAATPGTWLADHDGSSNVEELQDYVHLATDGPGHSSLFDTLNADARHRLIESDADEDGLTYTDVTGRANMKLVAALHEAAPAMLAELEAARALAAYLRSLVIGMPRTPLDGVLATYERARDGVTEAQREAIEP